MFKFAINVWDDQHPSSVVKTNEPIVGAIKRELNGIYENTMIEKQCVFYHEKFRSHFIFFMILQTYTN